MSQPMVVVALQGVNSFQRRIITFKEVVPVEIIEDLNIEVMGVTLSHLGYRRGHTL